MNATVAVRSLISIAGGGAVASVLGYAAMSFLNAVAYGMAASAGAHPTGRGSLELQLAAGLGVGFLGAVATSVWVLRRDEVLILLGRRKHADDVYIRAADERAVVAQLRWKNLELA